MSDKKIKNLVLSGGGFFGYAEIGALSELEKYSEYFSIENIKGVSVGSMVAALYAVGYTAEELNKIIFELDFDALIRDSSLPYFKLYDKYGMYDAYKLEEKVEELIRTKTHIKFCTFSQTKKNLTIIATNLNYQCPRIFDKEHSPDMIISKAVRMSIGYPLYMSPILFEGDLYGDGGEFINYPINTFNNLEETIGITFAAHNENDNGTLKSRIPINNFSEYVRAIALTMSRAAYVSQITEQHMKRSIVIHITENINSIQFNLTNDQKHFIFRCGVNAVKEQIDGILGTTIQKDIEYTLNKISESITDLSGSFVVAN